MEANVKTAEIMSPYPTTVEVTDSLAQALGKLEDRGIRHLPVLRDGEVVGVISDRDLLESTGWMWNEERGKAPVIVEDVLRGEPFTVTPDEPVASLAAKLVEWNVGCAPVVEDGRLLGIATEIDILRAFVTTLPSSSSGTAAVETCMTADVLTLEISATVAEVLALMRKHKLRHVPIVHGPRVVGLVSDRDVRATLGRALLGTTPVREFMTAGVQTIAPDKDLVHAARLMSKLKIGGLPVVERSELVGMITVTDLLEHCAGVLA
jgi:CBS domain-containing protein